MNKAEMKIIWDKTGRVLAGIGLSLSIGFLVVCYFCALFLSFRERKWMWGTAFILSAAIPVFHDWVNGKILCNKA